MSRLTGIQATIIKQPLAGKRIQNSKGKNIKSPSVCRDGDANPSYHPWEVNSLNNFIKGKQIQCGRKSTYHCNLKTVRWIKGYRNTCPIAGCCGTFNRPAPLELHNFNFSQKNITKKIEIKSFTIEYKHHGVGVDVSVGTGSIHKNWMGVFPYVDFYLYNGNTLIQKKRFNKKVPLAKNQSVKITFSNFSKKFTYNPKTDDLWIKIDYAGNGGGEYSTQATNPSIIYAKGLKMSMNYDFVDKPKVKPVSSLDVDILDNTLITDKRNPNNPPGPENGNCRTTVTQKIYYENTSPTNIEIKSKPKDVKVTSVTDTTTQTITYKFEDTSGIPGEKHITYHIVGTKVQLSTTIIAENYSNPDIDIETIYVKNQSYHNETFVDIGDGCWSTIDLYIDKVDNNSKLIPTLNNQPNVNLNQEMFLNAINALSCGYHTIFVYLNNNKYITKEIRIVPPMITFSTDIGGPYDQEDEGYVTVNIKRTDNNYLKNSINVKIKDQGALQIPAEYSFAPQESHEFEICVNNAGTYDVIAEYNDGCSDKQQIIGTYVVKPFHIQSYDALLIETNDTYIEYDSLVVREGDRFEKPVTYTNASFMDKFFENDFLLYGKDGHTSIGELGYGILAVKNIQTDMIENLCIELNPFRESTDALVDDKYDPLPSEWQTGMLQSFYDNFYNLNPNVSTVVEIYNIQNQDLINEGTENVILKIKEIRPGKTIELKIPFFNHYTKEIHMNFKLLGETCEVVDLSRYNSNQAAYNESSNNAKNNYLSKKRECSYINLSVNDLRTAELSIEGDDLDRNDYNSREYLDIIYKLKIPESECDSNTKLSNVNTQIINDFELKPVGYSIGDNSIQDFDYKVSKETGINSQYVPMIDKSICLKYTINDNTHYIRAVTDTDGKAILWFTIPKEFGKSEFYLDEILEKVDISYKGDSFHHGVNLNPGYSVGNAEKANTSLLVVNDYNKYKAEQKIPIVVILTKQSKTYKNIININNNMEYCSSVIHIYYETCQNKTNEKGFKTVFKTNSDQLVDNQTEAMIYCNVPTDLQVTGKLQKRLLENHDTNVLTLIARNGYKPNKNVYLKACIGPEDIRTGDYLALTAVDIDKKEYSYDQGMDVILWDIGEMDSYETKTCDVILESEAVGHNTIYINGYDYLHNAKQNVVFTKLNISKQNSKTPLYIDDIISLRADLTNYTLTSNQTLFGEVIFKQGLIKDTDLKTNISQIKQIQQNQDIGLKNALKEFYKGNYDNYIDAFFNENQQQSGESFIKNALFYVRKMIIKDKIDQYNNLYEDIKDEKLDNYQISKQLTDIQNYINNNREQGIDGLVTYLTEYITTNTLITTSEITTNTLITRSEINELLSLFNNDLDTILENADSVVIGYKTILLSSLASQIKSQLYVKTVAINHVSNLNGEYYSNAHIRAKGSVMYLWSEYKSSKTHLTNYIESMSNIISFNNIIKYDLTIKQPILTEDNQLMITLMHQEQEYFDKELSVKFYIGNEEITNTYFEDGKYVADLNQKQAGTYDIFIYIPDTDKINTKTFQTRVITTTGE